MEWWYLQVPGVKFGVPRSTRPFGIVTLPKLTHGTGGLSACLYLGAAHACTAIDVSYGPTLRALALACAGGGAAPARAPARECDGVGAEAGTRKHLLCFIGRPAPLPRVAASPQRPHPTPRRHRSRRQRRPPKRAAQAVMLSRLSATSPAARAPCAPPKPQVNMSAWVLCKSSAVC